MLTWTEIDTRAIAFQHKAHQANDKAVWEAYAKPWHPLDNEPSCVAYLMEMYQKLSS